ncbi:hypothetical protein PoB_002043000, partial [Plakobranchus ocellatus]
LDHKGCSQAFSSSAGPVSKLWGSNQNGRYGCQGGLFINCATNAPDLNENL